MKKTPSKYFVFIGLFFTSLSSIFIRFSNAPSLVISAYRMLFTVLILSLPLLINERKQLLNLKKREFFLCTISGIFLALHFATWITSINMTTIASSTVLVNLNPIFVAMASLILFKEKLSKKAILGIIIAFVGGLIIAFADTSNSTTSSHAIIGDILAFLGSIFLASYLIMGKIVRKNLNNLCYVFIVYTSATIVLFGLCLFTNTPIYPYSINEFLIFLALAFFCSILGHTVYNWLINYLPATFISISTQGEPIFASIIALILFKEIPSIFTVVGAITIISGIYYFIINQPSQ